MAIELFDDLLELIHNDIKTNHGESETDLIAPEEKLILTLRYLSTGCSVDQLYYTKKIGERSVSIIIRDVCDAIWNNLKDIVMPAPSRQKWIEISKEFEQQIRFPHCVGAVEGKLIKLLTPETVPSLLVLLATCDANYRFTLVEIEHYNKGDDTKLFQNSTLYKRLCTSSLKIPKPKIVRSNSAIELPYVFVGDKAFKLMENLMSPYCGYMLNRKEQAFNRRIKVAHNYIECTISIAVNRWKILRQPLVATKDFAKKIVLAIIALHNYVQSKENCTTCNEQIEHHLSSFSCTNRNQNDGAKISDAINVRAKFTEYFVNQERFRLRKERT